MHGATRFKPRRVRGALALVMALLAGLLCVRAGAPSIGPADAAPAPSDADRYELSAWRARQDTYLAWITQGSVTPGRVSSVLAFAERARRDPSFTWDDQAPDPSDFAGEFAKLAAYKDTGDFDINNYLFLLTNYRDDLRPDLVAALEQRVLDFKYWWTEPTPTGIIDSQYYWTENHEIIFLANEYIAGQMFPTTTFGNSGMTGTQHMEHARPLILKWLGQRARFGFSEWLSNIYALEDIKGLLLLADRSDDAELTRWSSAVLDLLVIELAANTHHGSFASTHGRSYEGARMTARRESTFSAAKLMFDATTEDFTSDNAAILATAQRYRPPAVAPFIARDPRVSTTSQHQGLPIDPLAPITSPAIPPPGLPYDDVMTWWALGGQFPWQIVPLSIDMLNTYDLWQTDNFQQALALKPIVDTTTIPQLQQLASGLAPQLNPGLLSEVDTTTWRSPEAMLSTAQDWRAGQRTEHALVWQASLGPEARVFVTHPANAGGAYWTGDGAAPRAAQVDNVNISVYAPQYDSVDTGPLAALGYLPETHAYFPVERFDQVVEQDGWVIGRKGDGYVALWSARPTEWRAMQPDDLAERGLTERFDLQALGGPDNVWVTEVGRAADWPGTPDPFAAFVHAITTAPITATPVNGPNHQPNDGYDITYTSPTRGTLTYGWTTPLTANGTTIDQHDNPRWASPWTTVARDTAHYCVTAGTATLDLDFTTLLADTPYPATGPACAAAPPTTTTTQPTPTSAPPSTPAPTTPAPVPATTPAALAVTVTPHYTG